MSRFGQVMPGVDALLIERGRKEHRGNRPVQFTPLRIVHGPEHWETLAAFHRMVWSRETS